ncbi:hypothetical protein PLA106_26105 [Pseudomonas amygdali pv. lachrymans str. M302278]|nr:hypothetical protein PLA106_26105 [Pseudomonas amygdali pv. lachrymans str. M302278]
MRGRIKSFLRPHCPSDIHLLFTMTQHQMDIAKTRYSASSNANLKEKVISVIQGLITDAGF